MSEVVTVTLAAALEKNFTGASSRPYREITAALPVIRRLEGGGNLNYGCLRLQEQPPS